MNEPTRIRWGILGPGNIAKDFFAGALQSANGKVVAIGARNPAKSGLADDFPGARIVDGYDALLDDREIDAVYIATVHPLHAEWAIKAAEKGKHVLCEKPMGLSTAEADAMFEAARKAGTFMAEAYMYRLHPLTARIVELVKNGTVGDCARSSRASVLPSCPSMRGIASSPMKWRAAHTGRGRLHHLHGTPHCGHRHIIGPDGADRGDGSRPSWPDGRRRVDLCPPLLSERHHRRAFLLGVSRAGKRAADPRHKCRIEVDHFWFAGGKSGGTSIIRIVHGDGPQEEVPVVEPRHLYSFEVEAAGDAIRAGRTEFAYPGMSRADTLGNLRVMDKWRAAIGLEYEGEKHTTRTRTVRGDKLARKTSLVRSGRIDGLQKEISLAALGLMEFSTFSSAATVLDAFFEAGGNLVDTAFLYGNGVQDRLVGEWMRSRGVRQETVVIAKGAHSPLCYPDVIGKQLTTSLERMGTDYVDIYFMHRDNPDIPVGEFVEPWTRR